MPRFRAQILPALSLVMLFVRCAQIAPLGGGKRDLKPPELLETIPADKSTDFNLGVITFRFDEFVQVRDIANQLLVSPGMKTLPEVSAEGKKVVVRLKRDELRPSTTYRLNFGSAIADMHEGNALKNFEFVFSTGPFIDTLKIGGSVTDAFTNKAVGAVMVGLYDNSSREDSLPYRKVPDYVARSGDDGKFSFGYLPVKTLEVYAFTDKNKNNLYDGETEKVAFLGEALNLISDTIINLKLFQEEATKTFIKKSVSPYYGIGQVIFNKKSKATVKTLNPANMAGIFSPGNNLERDTLTFYYKDQSDTLELIVQNVTFEKTDTIKILLPNKPLVKKKFKNYLNNTTGGRLGFDQPLRLMFPVWMDTSSTDQGRIKLRYKRDSLTKDVPVNGRWKDITTFEWSDKLKEGLEYTLTVDTGAFMSVYGTPCDSNVFRFRTQSRAELGKATIKLKVNKKQDYLVQLLNEQQQVRAEKPLSLSLSSSNAVSIDFTDVLPGTYTLKVIYDNNGNKKWDSGDLSRKLFPEPVFIGGKPVKLMADWEVEEEFIIKE